MNTFLSSNKTSWRLLRTIVQGVIGVIIANIDVITGMWDFSPELKVFLVPAVVAVLSPIMGAISSNGEVIEAYGGESAGNTVEEHEASDPVDEEE